LDAATVSGDAAVDVVSTLAAADVAALAVLGLLEEPVG
jgi:hypothetical protein